MKRLSQYTGILREIRLLYWLNNLVHYRQLRRNRPLYRQIGLKRSVLRSLDSRVLARCTDLYDPPGFAAPQPRDPGPEHRQLLHDFERDGFVVLRNHFSAEVMAAARNALDGALGKGKVHFNYTGRKIFNAHRELPELAALTGDRRILEVLHILLGRPARLFQSIGFRQGSEQQPHSDAIHMTTLPLGGLAGVWTALEEIHDDNGPLFYYPGSHKLPYILNADYGNDSNRWRLDGRANEKYERRVTQVIERHGLKPVSLQAAPGDVLIWHANLLHGGAPILREGSTRRSLVAHYFARGVLCYHEISERPAIGVQCDQSSGDQ